MKRSFLMLVVLATVYIRREIRELLDVLTSRWLP